MGKIIHTTNLSALGSQALADSDIMLVQKQTGVAIKTTLTELKSYIGGVTPPTQTHTVTFKVGSVVYATQSVVHGGSASRPADPDYQNCPVAMQYKTFLNWVGDYTNVVSDVTVTASCGDNAITVNVTDKVHTYDGQAHQYTVTPSLNYGGTPSVSYSTDGVSYQTTWPGNYTAVGTYQVWYKVTATNYQDKTGVESLVITASSTHTVKFMVNGVKYDEQQVTHGSDAQLPADPTYVNCPTGMQYKTFKSWNGTWQNVTEDRTLTADCDDNSISYEVTGTEVTYDGQSHMFDVAVTLSPEATYTIQWRPADQAEYSVTKPSYSAEGSYTVWFKITAANYETVESWDVLDIAIAPPTTHAVTFTDGADWSRSFNVVEGEKIAAADVPTAPQKTNYTFAAWQLNSVDTDPTTVTVTQPITFVARYVYNDPYTYPEKYFDSPKVLSWDTTYDTATIGDNAYDASKVKFTVGTSRSSVTAGVKWTVSVAAGTVLGTITDDTAMTKTKYTMRNAFSDSKTVQAQSFILTYYSND